MKGTPAIYLGRIVEKKHFRAFIHAPDGAKRLVESWDEFEANMQSGVWFATPEDAKASIEKPKPRSRAPRAKKEVPVITLELKEDAPEEDDFIEEELIDCPPEDAAFEVKDDFLPKG
jgi:hypothetical protein